MSEMRTQKGKCRDWRGYLDDLFPMGAFGALIIVLLMLSFLLVYSFLS